MPTVAVDREDLFARLGRRYEEAEFDELCFEFGVELDDVMTESEAAGARALGAPSAAGAAAKAAAGGDRVLYYIAVPANRYDLLCIEGIARALNVFLGRMPVPVRRARACAPPPPSRARARALTARLPSPQVYTTARGPLKVVVAASTAPLRPFVVCAALRGVAFTPARYASFIDLQDKLHQNICRRRTLVAIGTHDLAALAPPFRYSCEAPGSFSFVPLSQTRAFRGDELLDFYRTDPSVKHIKPYVDIVGGAPALPLIRDAAGTVLSLPPLINGEASKITLATRDVFVECTATDLAKAHVVLNTLLAMFCEYAAVPFQVETVDVEYEAPPEAFVGGGAPTRVAAQTTPDLSARVATASPGAIASLIGAPVAAARAAELLSRMGLRADVVRGDARAAAAAEARGAGARGGITASREGEEELLRVLVPPTRADVIHECDIAEDVAIAHGYANIARTVPRAAGAGAQLPINALSDKLRAELIAMGCDECLTLALVSRKDNYADMLLEEDGRAVVLANPQRCVGGGGGGAGGGGGGGGAARRPGPAAAPPPPPPPPPPHPPHPRSEEFQIGRTSVVPGLLKTLASNRAVSVRDGLRLFEVTDVMLQDAGSDVGARNERRVAALFTGPTAGFEVVHGIVDREGQGRGGRTRARAAASRLTPRSPPQALWRCSRSCRARTRGRAARRAAGASAARATPSRPRTAWGPTSPAAARASSSSARAARQSSSGRLACSTRASSRTLSSPFRRACWS